MRVKSFLSIACFSTIAATVGLSGWSFANATETPLSSTSGTETQPAAAVNSPADSAGKDDRLAQFFPFASSNEQVVMVQGMGTASAPAETAAIEFVLVNYDPYYDPYACTYDDWSDTTSDSGADPTTAPEECPPPPDPVPLTRASVQPVVDALTDAGIDASEISVRLPGDESDSYAAYYYVDSASVLLTLDRPSHQQVADLVTAVEDVMTDSEAVYLQDRYVQYTLSESGCNALETEAYGDAVSDARDRAAVLATALGVEVGDVPSVADAAYSPFSLSSLTAAAYPSYCDADLYNASYGGYYASPSYYDAAMPAEVQVQRAVYVTYPVGR